jgi:hypothetical protein
MLSSFVYQMDKTEEVAASFGAPAEEEMLVIAAQNGNEEAF